jgi:hypothetical protein
MQALSANILTRRSFDSFSRASLLESVVLAATVI